MSGEFAGTLRERVIIERPVEARTSIGVQQFGWERVASCLAAIVPEGAGPEREAMALSVMPRFQVTIRYRDGIAIDQRLRWGTRVLMVRQMLSDPRLGDRIVMRCEEARS
ncbi:MAG: head-tail adaptor protein [Sphingomicrobium sp.]